jgi:hypothetical protein
MLDVFYVSSRVSFLIPSSSFFLESFKQTFARCSNVAATLNLDGMLAWWYGWGRWVGKAILVMVVLTVEWAVVSTLAGGVGDIFGAYADGNGTKAGFKYPVGVAVDVSGNVFVADTDNQRIRKLSAVRGMLLNESFSHECLACVPYAVSRSYSVLRGFVCARSFCQMFVCATCICSLKCVFPCF